MSKESTADLLCIFDKWFPEETLLIWSNFRLDEESDFLIPYSTNNALICFQDLQQSVFNAEMIEEQSLEVNMVHLLHILWNNEIT